MSHLCSFLKRFFFLSFFPCFLVIRILPYFYINDQIFIYVHWVIYLLEINTYKNKTTVSLGEGLKSKLLRTKASLQKTRFAKKWSMKLIWLLATHCHRPRAIHLYLQTTLCRQIEVKTPRKTFLIECKNNERFACVNCCWLWRPCNHGNGNGRRGAPVAGWDSRPSLEGDFALLAK